MNKKSQNPTTDCLAFFQMYQRYMKCIFSQISNCFEKILSRYQFRFRKGYSTKQCLLVIVEKWPLSLNKGGHYGALLTDLSKAFDYLSHD